MSQPTQLSDYGVISVTGPDSSNYLQGQLTCDLNSLAERGYLAGCHCDAKGKMWSNFWLYKNNQEILLVMRQGVLLASLAALQKFGVFSNCQISDASGRYFIYGSSDSTSLDANIPQIPMGDGRVLLISSTELACEGTEQQWQLQQIQQGLPELAVAQQTAEFVPQMLNQADLGAICFKKGCYIGQETVARMRYLGKQKRATFYLKGQATNISAGDELEIERGGNWRRSGQVINAVDIDGEAHLLAVLPSDANEQGHYRKLADESSKLTIQPLPYSPASQLSES